MKPETNYVKLFKSSPSKIKISVVITIVLLLNDLIAACISGQPNSGRSSGTSYGPIVMCAWAVSWMLKGFGSIRWIIAASEFITLAGLYFSIKQQQTFGGYAFELLVNFIVCAILLWLLYSKESQEWFKRKGIEYYEWRKGTVEHQ